MLHVAVQSGFQNLPVLYVLHLWEISFFPISLVCVHCGIQETRLSDVEDENAELKRQLLAMQQQQHSQQSRLLLGSQIDATSASSDTAAGSSTPGREA